MTTPSRPSPEPKVLSDEEFKALCYRWTATGQVIGIDVLCLHATVSHWKSRALESEREGWKLVPREPTEEMYAAWPSHPDVLNTIWKKLYDAAPVSPQVGQK